MEEDKSSAFNEKPKKNIERERERESIAVSFDVMTAYFLDRPQQVFHRARCKSWPPSSLSPCRCFLRKGRIPGRTSGAFSRRTPALRLSSSRDQARRSTFHFAVSCSSSSNSAESEAVFRECKRVGVYVHFYSFQQTTVVRREGKEKRDGFLPLQLVSQKA